MRTSEIVEKDKSEQIATLEAEIARGVEMGKTVFTAFIGARMYGGREPTLHDYEQMALARAYWESVDWEHLVKTSKVIPFGRDIGFTPTKGIYEGTAVTLFPSKDGYNLIG